MHPQAKPYLDAVADPAIRARLAVFFDAYDSMDRENTHLRVKLQAEGCPYGHASARSGCELGYPGCACMDDMLAMQSWAPEDEAKAAVRISRRLFATEQALDGLRQAATGLSLILSAAGRPDEAKALREAVAQAKPQVPA